MGVEHKDSMTLVQMSLVYEGCCHPPLEETLLGCRPHRNKCGDISACQGEAGPGFVEVNGPRPSASRLIGQEHSGSC